MTESKEVIREPKGSYEVPKVAHASYVTPPMTPPPPASYTFGTYRRGSDTIVSPIRSTQISPPLRNMPRSVPASFTFGNPRKTPEQPNYAFGSYSVSPKGLRDVSISPTSNRRTVQERIQSVAEESEDQNENISDDEEDGESIKSGRSFLKLVRNISIKRHQRRKKVEKPVVISEERDSGEFIVTRLEKKEFENGVSFEKVDINYDWDETAVDNPIINNKTSFNNIATILYCEDNSEPIQITNMKAFDATITNDNNNSNSTGFGIKSILKQKQNFVADKELYFAKKMDKVLPESIMKMTEYRVSRSSDPVWKTKCANYRKEQIIKSSYQ